MSPSLRLRLRLLALAAPAVHGCSSTPATGPESATPPATATVAIPSATTTSTTATTATATAKPTATTGLDAVPPPPTSPSIANLPPSPAKGDAWLLNGYVCATAPHTDSKMQTGPGAPFANCGGAPDFTFVSNALQSLPCGPCAFSFAAAVTTQARQNRPDACCYQTHSPPLGRPLNVEGDARLARVVVGAWG